MIDIEFDHAKATEKQLVYNEIYPPIIEKKNSWSMWKVGLSVAWTEFFNRKGNPQSYRATKKAHATLVKKKFQHMYLEQLPFSINRAGWCVTKIYLHHTFEQECFKKNFILMNQCSRQNAKNSIEKNFNKLMNNSNFGYECRNNLDNCQFLPIFDELQVISYLKR